MSESTCALSNLAEDGRESIVIEYLDRSTAFAVPTWCSSSTD
jgi:hypothetical protein